MKCIILGVDESVKEVPLDTFITMEKKNIAYVLLPNPDDDNFFIVENSDILNTISGRIEYDMSIYSYEDVGFSMDDAEAEFDIRHNVHEIHNVYDLYCAIYSILKLNYILNLFFDTFMNDDSIECFIINNLIINFMVDGEEIKYEWKMNNKGSIFSRMTKLANDLYKTFHIPHSDFTYSNNVIRIRDNKWKEIKYKKVKMGDLIGFTGGLSMTLQFITASSFNLNCIENMVEAEIYGIELSSIKEEYPDIEENLAVPAYISRIDVGLLSDVYFLKVVGLALDTHQRVEFLGNIKYICKYIEAYISMVSSIKYNEAICIINLNLVYRDTVPPKDGINNENRIEANITKYNPYILK